MSIIDIRDICHLNSNTKDDTFVGIRCDNGVVNVTFPMGYHISTDERGIRNDILRLLNTIVQITGNRDSELLTDSKLYTQNGFPLQAYMYVISDYYDRGYYKEREIQYHANIRGKIDWNRTIKKQKPYIYNNDAYYLQFITRKNPLTENELITQIHEYCVYESFCKIGWLFTRTLPQKPRIKFNRKRFLRVVREKYDHTFNDKNKELFRNLIAIIERVQDSDSPRKFYYGVDPFDHVWEALIDKVYGIKNKQDYFPKTEWKLPYGTYGNSDLRPDSIMLWNGNVYVLDAKNYKYGITRNSGDLPKSTDINKQITYGEFADGYQSKLTNGDKAFNTYNAFLMPFDAHEWNNEGHLKWIGEATSSWKNNTNTYERIQGILVDVKSLMIMANNHDDNAISELASCIEHAVIQEDH